MAITWVERLAGKQLGFQKELEKYRRKQEEEEPDVQNLAFGKYESLFPELREIDKTQTAEVSPSRAFEPYTQPLYNPFREFNQYEQEPISPVSASVTAPYSPELAASAFKGIPSEEDKIREQAKQAGKTHYWYEPEKTWKMVGERDVEPEAGQPPEPRKGVGFVFDILSSRRTTENPKGLNVVEFAKQYPAAEAAITGIPIAATLGVIGYEGIRLATNSLLYGSIMRNLSLQAKARNIPLSKEEAGVFAKGLTSDLSRRFSMAKNWKHAFDLVRGKYVPKPEIVKEAENIAKEAVNQYIPSLIPRATQTGAMAYGGIGKPAQIIKVLPSPQDTQILTATQASGKKIGLDVEAIGGIAPNEYWVSVTTPALKGSEAFNDWIQSLREKDFENAQRIKGLLEGKFEVKEAPFDRKGEKRFIPFKNIQDAQRFLATGDMSLVAKEIRQRGVPWTPEQLAQAREASQKDIARRTKGLEPIQQQINELQTQVNELEPTIKAEQDIDKWKALRKQRDVLEKQIGELKTQYVQSILKAEPVKPTLVKPTAVAEKITAIPKEGKIIPEVGKPPTPEVAKPPVTPEKQVTQLAEQLKAKLAAEPPPVKPKSPLERRTEIQALLKEPAKNLPKGTSKIALRKELADINKSLIPQEKKLRQQIMASAKVKSLPEKQYRQIFKDTGGSRRLTDIGLPELEKVLKSVQRARPVTIHGKKVIKPKTEALIQSSKKDLIDEGILTEETYKDILKSQGLSTDKYVDSTNFITNSQGSDIIREMRNIAILNPLGELKFKKPSAIKYLTSNIYYAQVLGVKPLTEPLELAKVDFDLAYRAMSQSIDNKLRAVNKLWKTKKGETLRDLLDKTEEAPAELTTKQKELFNWFRNLNRTIINGENEVRRAMGIEEIPYRQAYVRHIPDTMAREIISGTHPIPPSLAYWSRRLVSKKIFNPMEFHRELSDDLAKLYTKDLAFASKDMVYTGLKEIHLAQPLRAFTERMGALSDIMPAQTRKWVTDYINQVIKGQQTEWDENINAIVTESGVGGLIDKVLSPFRITLGRQPVTQLATTIGKGTIFAVMALPRPRLARLMIRNTFQRTQELAMHGVVPTLTSFLPDPKELKALKAQSEYLKSYTGVEEWPADLMGKVAKIPLAPYQFTAVLNADRGMSVAWYDYYKFFANKKYKELGWASEKRTYEEPMWFLYPEEKELMLKEMELATRACQYQYIGMGMPEIFRNKTLIPLTRFQSWWMNYFTMFHREAFHRFAYGETMSGKKLPWSSRVNWLKYLLLGGAILTSMGYEMSYLWKVLPHNESPFAQFAVGLVKYVAAGSDWERAQAKRDMMYSWKAIVPGAMAVEEIQKLWSGEMPLWQMFFYGRKEEGPPPHKPTWGLPEAPSSVEKFTEESAKDFEEYDLIPSNPDELKAALRDKTVRYSRSDYREHNPEIDAKLFITGQVSTVKTNKAASEVIKLIKENKIDPTEISAVKAWQEAEEKRKELGLRDTSITLTERLIQKLLPEEAGVSPLINPFMDEGQPSPSATGELTNPFR